VAVAAEGFLRCYCHGPAPAFPRTSAWVYVQKFIASRLAIDQQSDQYLKKQTVLIVFSTGEAVQLNTKILRTGSFAL
jgi:hypothetical protein